MDALEEMEFPQFVEPLKTSLEGKIIKHWISYHDFVHSVEELYMQS
jgi:hypothetical protein